MTSVGMRSPGESASSLQIYLDDSIYSRLLRMFLLQAGHKVVVPADVTLAGARDDLHFAYARDHQLTLATKNPADFLKLHEQHPDHSGILLVYRDNDRTRDMSDLDIARAVGNLIAAGVPIAGEAHTLNHWRY